MAGIGNPQRFYRTLQELGAQVTEHSFADHYAFTAQDFAFAQPQRMLVMTEKDWVKCRDFAADYWWYLQVGGDGNTGGTTAVGPIITASGIGPGATLFGRTSWINNYSACWYVRCAKAN